jgi:hypothetical protein
MKTIKFEKLEDKYFGKKGTQKRKKYESEAKREIQKQRKLDKK